MNEYWKNYNLNLEKISKKFLLHNQANDFNCIEDSFYNHVRDMVGLAISIAGSSKE